MVDLQIIEQYFLGYFQKFGPSPEGLNWNSVEAQVKRFEQLCKVINFSNPFSILDYGCGFGSLFDFLKDKGQDFTYVGYDILEAMISKGKELHFGNSNCRFINNLAEVSQMDYVIESGVFNVKQENEESSWTEYINKSLNKMFFLANKGIACNFLTKYSDIEYMKPHLYYADPLFLFDYCKKNFSKNVALLHDYDLYDFTIIIRR
jgi:SAM-dependent methyltransferase